MKKHRIIARLDVKGPNVVKGIQMEGLRVVGQPGELAGRYYDQGADEIVYIDIVASLYERNNLLHVIEEATELGVAIPLTVGGGIRDLGDITKILRAGADKVAINTAATRRPEMITEAARKFGSQCIVGSVQANTLSTALDGVDPVVLESWKVAMEDFVLDRENRLLDDLGPRP